MHSFSACSGLTEKKEANAYTSFCSLFEGEILQQASLFFFFAKWYMGFVNLNVSKGPQLLWRATMRQEIAM